MSLTDPITTIPLIGPSQAEKLAKLHIHTIKDLLFHIPIKYRDTSTFQTIEETRVEKEGTVQAKVESIKNIYTRSRKVITRAVVSDSSGSAVIVWFNQRFIIQAIQEGEYYIFELKLPKKEGAKDFYCSDFEKTDKEELAHLGRITPFYDQTAGVSSKWLRSRLIHLKKAIDNEQLEIPSNIDDLLGKEGMTNLQDAIYKIHFPDSFEDIQIARHRLGFEELLELGMKIEQSIKERKKYGAHKLQYSKKDINEFLSTLKFELTGDQRKSLDEILEDISADSPMHRLLNGDVGSGKTIVAAAATYIAALNGFSSVIMAPTTILAQQHFRSFEKLLDKFGIKVQLLISGQALEPTVKPQVIIGTHALLHEDYLPENIALVIIDEQHRFGVQQRNQLLKPTKPPKSKSQQIRPKQLKARTPHYLTMTATPIPRTLTHVLFGDMEISLIKEMPKNRIPIESHLVPQNKIAAGMQWIHDMIIKSDKVEQAYIIFPLVEESEKSDLKDATTAHDILSKTFFKDLKVGLLHGRLKDVQKDEILTKFKDKEFNVLVSTTVVEVGIDIPDATIIVIENAERFGLAQLHQLRGRVGRGDRKSYCFVIPSKEVQPGSKGYERLKYFCEHPSGFDVAEYDLKSRGPGEVYGARQSGIPMLKIADIMDFEGLKKARKVAKSLLKP